MGFHKIFLDLNFGRNFNDLEAQERISLLDTLVESMVRPVEDKWLWLYNSDRLSASAF